MPSLRSLMPNYKGHLPDKPQGLRAPSNQRHGKANRHEHAPGGGCVRAQVPSLRGLDA